MKFVLSSTIILTHLPLYPLSRGDPPSLHDRLQRVRGVEEEEDLFLWGVRGEGTVGLSHRERAPGQGGFEEG